MVPGSTTPEALTCAAVGGVVCVLLIQTNKLPASVAEIVTDISWSGLVPGAMVTEFRAGSISGIILMCTAA